MLSYRLKAMRKTLNKSQKEMARTLDLSLRTWQNYEEGIHDPSWKVVASIAEMGFSVDWLLTGVGEMERGTSGAFWSERIKEIRGDLTISEFANSLKIRDIDVFIAKIQAIEDKKINADFSLMNVLSCQLGISVDWMFGVPGAPKMISERDSASINVSLLEDVINEAALFESLNPGMLSSQKKAELMAELYAMRAVKER